jgi:hypothetical protein
LQTHASKLLTTASRLTLESFVEPALRPCSRNVAQFYSDKRSEVFARDVWESLGEFGVPNGFPGAMRIKQRS